MIFKDEVKLGNVAELLGRLVDDGTLTLSMGSALKSVVSSVFRTVFGVNWRDTAVSNMDTDEVFATFTREKVKSGGFGANGVYRIRFNRAMGLYSAYFSKYEADRRVTKKENDDVEIIRKLADTVDAAQSALLPYIIGSVFNERCRKDYELYAVPAGNGKIAALALPKGMTGKEVDQVDYLIDGIFICSKVKKGVKT